MLTVPGEHDQKPGVHLARWARAQLERFLLALTYRELAVRIGAELPLAEAAEAHRALEGRRSTVKVPLRVATDAA